jgi:hypothetical protein
MRMKNEPGLVHDPGDPGVHGGGTVTTHFPAVAYHVQVRCGNRLEIRRKSRRQGAGAVRPVLWRTASVKNNYEKA